MLGSLRGSSDSEETDKLVQRGSLRGPKFRGCRVGLICLVWLIAPVLQAESNHPPQSQESEAVKLLHEALRQAVWGPPMLCKLRQTVRLYDKQLIGIGDYVHAGQGTGKLKMILQFSAGDKMNSVLQASDGRILTTQESVGGNSQRWRVDLVRVTDRLKPFTQQSVDNPLTAMYMAVGGQAEVLRKLCLQYEWSGVEVGELNDHPIWWLDGKLASKAPPLSSRAQVDLTLSIPNQSGLLPVQVRVALGKTEKDTLWPYRIEYSGNKSDDPKRPQVSIALEYNNPTYLPNLPKDLFLTQEQPAGSVDAVMDLTARYLPPHGANVLTASGSTAKNR